MGGTSQTLREIMKQPARTIRANMPVRNAAQHMAISRVGCVLVVDDSDSLVGVFTERDLLRMFTTRLDPPLGEPVEEHMSRHPLTLDAGVSVDAGAQFMRDNMVRHIPLLESGRLVGVVSLRDVSRWA